MSKVKTKTRSAAKKRFKVVGGAKSKKIKRGKAFRRHLLGKMTTKSKRQLRKGGYVVAADEKRMMKLLGKA
jgi:large subunit ribosomal protein L35